MSFTNSLKSTGAMVSSAKNQYSDIDRMFQGYPQNPYMAQQSEMYDSGYYPGYHMPSNPHGYGLKYGSSAPHDYGYGHEQGYGGGGGHQYQPAQDSYHEVQSYGGHAPSQPRHKSKGNSSAMSALTLLAFLFFLNILQSCLKEHMMAMNPTFFIHEIDTQNSLNSSMEMKKTSKNLILNFSTYHVMVMTAGASSRNKNVRRTDLDEDDSDLKDPNSNFKITSTGDGTDFESDSSKFPKSEYIYRKFFNESDIKYQNANNYYKRKPHRPS